MFRKIKAIHFVGIGGSGMSGIAEILLNSGYRVSGSDLKGSATTKRLQDLGAAISIGHDPQNVGGAEVVVYSSAIRRDNPELIASQYRGIPIIGRAEMLAELMRMKDGIAVAGAHGKTTTTSMIAHILAESELDPTVIIGGRLNKYDSNAKLGRGNLLVAEADESDGSFMRLSPTISIVTNLDEEHMDHYKGGMAEIEETFLAFMNKVPFFGLVVACKDDPRLERLLTKVTRKVLTYGLKGGADISAANVKAKGLTVQYELMVRGVNLGRIELAVPGLHNVLNSLAAVAIGLEFDLSINQINEGLKKFTGADRRFHHVGEARNRLIIDDYAHHPTEIMATLEAARSAYDRRLVAIFQPHRYTRFQSCWDRFLVCFDLADEVLVVPVYPAGEDSIKGVDSQRFAEELAKTHAKVGYLENLDDLASHLEEHTVEGDLILGLGAGTISMCCRKVYEAWV